jgi:membrane-associated phospholipid phosphatase
VRFLDQLTDRQEKGALAAFLFVAYGLYWPLSWLTARLPGHHPELAIDRATPLLPGAVWIYALVWASGALPATVPTSRALFRRIAAAYLAVIVIAYGVFVAYPVHMALRPPPPTIEGISTWGLAMIYTFDQPSNCLPSLHVAVAMLAGLSAWSADKLIGVGGVVVALAIAASTMLVKQHYFVDAASGALLALGAWWVCVRPLKAERRPPDRRGPLAMTAAQGCFFAGMTALYLSGYVPG